MCLVVLAHRASERFPLVLAANRDEDYDRATHEAHFWPDLPDILGGRDGLHGGTWLAVARNGRFAAVTNLRGAVARGRSRGFLVRDYVRDGTAPRDTHEYAGFHFLGGTIGGEALYASPERQSVLDAGIHAFSNAPADEQWPKTGTAAAAMRAALSIQDAAALTDELMRMLAAPLDTGDPRSEIFIADQRYGTRSSTVIVATAEEVFFAEQSFARGGVSSGERRNFSFSIGS